MKLLRKLVQRLRRTKMTKEAAKTAKKWIDDADAILVTASNGLSISEGLNLFANDAKLKEVLGDLVDKYHFPNLLAAFGFHYPNELDHWRVIARTVEYYSNNYQPSVYMQDLNKIIVDKPYFVWTSNVDHHFTLSGFEHVFEIEGNWMEGVCSAHLKKHGVVNLAKKIHEFYVKDQAGTLTEADIPSCEKCGAPLNINTTANPDFQIDQKQINDFQDFIQKYEDKKLLVLELGIGPRNQMIKAPSMQLVAADNNSRYITINKGELNIPDLIADRSIGYSASIGDAFKELLSGKSYGATTQGPTKPQPKPELTPQQKAEQAKVMQQFYPNYMVDMGIRPGSFQMYLTIDQKNPSYLHTVQYGQSMMYSIGDAAIVHCFTQDGQYYKVRLGLNKKKDEVHGFYVDPGTFTAIEDSNDVGVSFSQISIEIPNNVDGAILVPKKNKLLQMFPDQKDIIERFCI